MTKENTIFLAIMQANADLDKYAAENEHFLAIGQIDNNNWKNFVGSLNLPLYPELFYKDCATKNCRGACILSLENKYFCADHISDWIKDIPIKENLTTLQTLYRVLCQFSPAIAAYFFDFVICVGGCLKYGPKEKFQGLKRKEFCLDMIIFVCSFGGFSPTFLKDKNRLGDGIFKLIENDNKRKRSPENKPKNSEKKKSKKENR